MTGRCSHCGEVRPLADLLRVVPRRQPWRHRLVCRPSVRPFCFTDSTASAALERIEAAAIDPAPTGAPTVGGPTP